MSKKGVWHPDTSLAAQDDGCEERGRGSLVGKQAEQSTTKMKIPKTKIPRRRTPTVDVSAIMNSLPKRRMEPSIKASTPEGTYKTIETHSGPGFLECSSVVYRRGTQQATRVLSDFCGWTERESLDSYRNIKTTGSHTSSGVMERRDVNTPADNLRPAIRASASRYSSSYGYRKRSDYEFRHLVDTHEYIDQYRQLYSYTTHVASQKRGLCMHATTMNDHEMFEPQEVEQDPQSLMPIGVKSWYRGDPYLREIVNRLGVKDIPREQQLLKTPKPTPPSIVKKSKNQADLTIRANGRISSNEDISLPNSEIESPIQNSPKSSRPVSRSVQHGVAGSLELPNIAQTTHIRPSTQRGNKTNSVISVNKYLQVTSHNRQDITEEGEEEEDGEAKEKTDEKEREISDSLRTLSNEIISQHFSNGSQERLANEEVVFQFPRPATLTMQEQMLYFNSTQREKLISNKAHSLGLISRDWSKMRRTMNRNLQALQSEEAEDETEYRYTLYLKTSKRNQGSRTQERLRVDQATGQVHQNSTPKRLSSAHRDHNHRLPPSRPKTRAEDIKKLERLKTIYEPSSKRNSKRRNHTSRQPSRCESRAAASRPPTRAMVRRQSSKPRHIPSRPATRAAVDRNFQRTVRGQSKVTEDTEGGTYWNEVPIKPHCTCLKASQSRPTTGKKQSEATNSHQQKTKKNSAPAMYHHFEKSIHPSTPISYKQNVALHVGGAF